MIDGLRGPELAEELNGYRKFDRNQSSHEFRCKSYFLEGFSSTVLHSLAARVAEGLTCRVSQRVIGRQVSEEKLELQALRKNV